MQGLQRVIKRIVPFLLVIVFISLMCLGCLAQQNVPISITVTESGKVTDYYGQYYVVNVAGSVSINNPSNLTIFNVLLPHNLGYLNFIDSSDSGYFYSDKIFISTLEPHTTVNLPYSIIGIITNNPVKNNQSVFLSSVKKEAGA